MSRDRGRDRGGGGCGRSVNTGRHGRGRRVMETQESRGGRCGIQVETGSRDGVNMWWWWGAWVGGMDGGVDVWLGWCHVLNVVFTSPVLPQIARLFAESVLPLLWHVDNADRSTEILQCICLPFQLLLLPSVYVFALVHSYGIAHVCDPPLRGFGAENAIGTLVDESFHFAASPCRGAPHSQPTSQPCRCTSMAPAPSWPAS